MKKVLALTCCLAFLVYFWPAKAQAFIPTMVKPSGFPTPTPVITDQTNGDDPTGGVEEDIPTDENVNPDNPDSTVEEGNSGTTDTSGTSGKKSSAKKKSSSANIFSTVWDWVKSHLKPTYCLSKFWFWFLVLVPLPLILLLLLIIFILLLRGSGNHSTPPPENTNKG